MLPMTKKHLRVDVDEDDDLITEYLAWAIGYGQNFSALQIFGAEVDFMPDGGDSRYRCPVQPVSAFTAADAGWRCLGRLPAGKRQPDRAGLAGARRWRPRSRPASPSA